MYIMKTKMYENVHKLEKFHIQSWSQITATIERMEQMIMKEKSI